MDKKLRYIQENLKNYLLVKFLKSCIYMHALAFFQWRYLYNSHDNKLSLKEVIADRLEYLRKTKRQQAENLDRA